MAYTWDHPAPAPKGLVLDPLTGGWKLAGAAAKTALPTTAPDTGPVDQWGNPLRDLDAGDIE